MLRAFGNPVTMCCDMLGVVGSSLETPKISQHVRNSDLRPTMLQYVASKCCDRLAGDSGNIHETSYETVHKRSAHPPVCQTSEILVVTRKLEQVYIRFVLIFGLKI